MLNPMTELAQGALQLQGDPLLQATEDQEGFPEEQLSEQFSLQG